MVSSRGFGGGQEAIFLTVLSCIVDAGLELDIGFLFLVFAVVLCSCRRFFFLVIEEMML